MGPPDIQTSQQGAGVNGGVQSAEAEKAAVESLLSSGIFRRAPTLERLLKYICQKHFEGKADELKEYTIAVEALGRPPEFDPDQNSIVRVEAHRLRKLLDRYYGRMARDYAVRIVIPPGQYSPLFIHRSDPSADGACGSPEQPDLASVGGETPDRAIPERAVGHNRRSVLIYAVAGCALVGALVSGLWPVWTSRSTGATGRAASGVGVQVSSVTASEAIRIIAGMTQPNYADRSGHVWQGDRFFHGGDAFVAAAPLIHRTTEPLIYQTRREGDFSYDIPLKPGCYELHLHFAETIFGPGNVAGGGEGTRVFQVSVNGKPILSEFDVLSEAGGANIALERVFKDISPDGDGLLHIRFLPLLREKAILSGIEILPSTCGSALPIRILCRDRGYTDSMGRFWGADRYVMGGQLINRPEPVAGAEDPGIHRGERYGNFNYEIPVPPGRYSVTFRFSEQWFGPGRPGGGGARSRVFDVYCNGVRLLKSFDIFSEAGGSGRALVRTFQGLEPNAQGKLVFSFVPIKNYACINAIEVLDEVAPRAMKDRLR